MDENGSASDGLKSKEAVPNQVQSQYSQCEAGVIWFETDFFGDKLQLVHEK